MLENEGIWPLFRGFSALSVEYYARNSLPLETAGILLRVKMASFYFAV
jgi:hypothetical protein